MHVCIYVCIACTCTSVRVLCCIGYLKGVCKRNSDAIPTSMPLYLFRIAHAFHFLLDMPLQVCVYVREYKGVHVHMYKYICKCM